MIREIPVDTSRINLVSTGHVVPVMPWVPDPANPDRQVPGTVQSTDDITGLLLWNVDVLAEDLLRAEAFAVQVGASHQPVLEKYKPVTFIGLSVRTSVNRATGVTRQYWAATGISEGKNTATPAPAPKTSSSPFDQKAS